MKYPKNKSFTFIQFSEFDCKQVNISKGKLYNYWWIQPNLKCIKLNKGEIPEILKITIFLN